ncbi:MAG: IS30 family transposase [Planctomycetota bacterium]|jgi:IS30 family transposase
MGKRYVQLGIEERCEIARLRASGCSIRQVAAALDRAPSSVARELKRNSSRQSGYQPKYAEERCRARRWTGSKLDRDRDLREAVLSRLARKWSPEQVAASLARDMGRPVISYETIYRFIYAQIARTKDYNWRRYLPWAKSKRGRRSRKNKSPASFIAHRRPLSQRPEEANDRQTPGHWEADLMLFRIYGQAVLTLHERYSRLLIAVRLPSKEAEPTAQAMTDILAPLSPHWRQTVTFDNGTEFALHYKLHALDIQTFFCDTYSPWQKGGVENAIGRMRRTLPRKTDLVTLSNERFTQLIQAYNNTPRKCLDFRSPAEVFWNEVLHFKCESTFPRPRE